MHRIPEYPCIGVLLADNDSDWRTKPDRVARVLSYRRIARWPHSNSDKVDPGVQKIRSMLFVKMLTGCPSGLVLSRV